MEGASGSEGEGRHKTADNVRWSPITLLAAAVPPRLPVKRVVRTVQSQARHFCRRKSRAPSEAHHAVAHPPGVAYHSPKKCQKVTLQKPVNHFQPQGSVTRATRARMAQNQCILAKLQKQNRGPSAPWAALGHFRSSPWGGSESKTSQSHFAPTKPHSWWGWGWHGFAVLGAVSSPALQESLWIM